VFRSDPDASFDLRADVSNIAIAATVGPIDAPDIDDFLEEVYTLAGVDDLQAATDRIFDTMDRLLLRGAFTACNEILRRVDLHRLPTALMRSFLTITAAAKDRLPARKLFYKAVLAEMTRLKGDEKANRLLGQLA
jgi:hypothetical protein